MTAVWILLGIAGFLALLLSFSLTFYVHITDRVELKAGAFGLRFQILPSDGEEEPAKEKKRRLQKKSRKSKPKQKEAEESKQKLAKKKTDETSFSDTLSLIWAILKGICPTAARMLSHLRLTRLKLSIRVAGPEADQTAIRYGQICAGIYPLLGALDSAIRLRVKWVDIYPDFVREESVYDISFRVKLRLNHLIGGVFAMAFHLLANLLRRKKQEEQPAARDGKARHKAA